MPRYVAHHQDRSTCAGGWGETADSINTNTKQQTTFSSSSFFFSFSLSSTNQPLTSERSRACSIPYPGVVGGASLAPPPPPSKKIGIRFRPAQSGRASQDDGTSREKDRYTPYIHLCSPRCMRAGWLHGQGGRRRGEAARY